MQNLKALIGSWYQAKGSRFQAANKDLDAINPFDIPTELVQDMISRQVRPFVVQTINLTNAGELFLEIPGMHITLLGHTGSATKAVNTTAYCELYWGKVKIGDSAYPLKHNRGVSGPFAQVTLRWPAQPGVYADVIIFDAMFSQWVNGEAAT